MKKVIFIVLIALGLCFDSFAGSLDYLENGEYAFFVDRRGGDEVYYKGILYLEDEKNPKEKIFVIRSLSIKTGKELVFYMYIDDSTNRIQGTNLVGVDNKPIRNNEAVAIATDFIHIFQFYIDNQHKIEKMVNLIYKAPNLPPSIKVATSSAPYFKMFKLGGLFTNSGEAVLEIDRMGVLQDENDFKEFFKYDVLKGNNVTERRSEKLLAIPKAKKTTVKIKNIKCTIDANWVADTLPGLDKSYRLPISNVKQNSLVAVERTKLSNLPKNLRSAEAFLGKTALIKKGIIASSIKMYDWNGFTRVDYDIVEESIINKLSILSKVKEGELIIFYLFSFADIRSDNEAYYDKILKSVKF